MLRTKRADFSAIAERFGIDQVTARVLRNRDICTDEEIGLFLNGGFGDLYDEMLLPDIDKAAGIILSSIAAGEHIRVVGDYDIDGVCSVKILQDGLKRAGADADHVIPDRVRDGYGINLRMVEEAAADGVDLIVTCDNGIAAFDELKRARELGLKVVVTDHHNIRQENGVDVLPEADAVVNAKRSCSGYPTTEICGAVTAWKLIRVLYGRLGISDDEWLEFLEFAALATVGDIMPLKGENRIIVKEGLKKINNGYANMGLRKLIEASQLKEGAVNAYHIGYVIGPCINAGGRLENAEEALKLFLAEDEAEAEIMALHLRSLNEERKNLTERGTEAAFAMVDEKYADSKVIVVVVDGLHESLAGIVAGRVRERYCRPTIVLTQGENCLKGSARSIEAYNMFDGLSAVADLMEKFGGHAKAAGLSIKEENVEEFRRRLNEGASLKDEDFVNILWIDAPMPVDYVSMGLVEEFKRLEPYGTDNERPLFAEKGLRAERLQVLGRNRNALRFILRKSNGFSVGAIMFGDADALKAEIEKGQYVGILYRPDINEFRGNRTLQIVVDDIVVS